MVRIDMWYDDEILDVTGLSVCFSDIDCVYRGN